MVPMTAMESTKPAVLRSHQACPLEPVCSTKSQALPLKISRRGFFHQTLSASNRHSTRRFLEMTSKGGRKRLDRIDG
jgi:hypothetical protein